MIIFNFKQLQGISISAQKTPVAFIFEKKNFTRRSTERTGPQFARKNSKNRKNMQVALTMTQRIKKIERYERTPTNRRTVTTNETLESNKLTRAEFSS